jgi:hypothetical protein
VESARLSEAVPAGLLRELKRVVESPVADAGVELDLDRHLDDKNTLSDGGASETLLALARIAKPLSIVWSKRVRCLQTKLVYTWRGDIPTPSAEAHQKFSFR